MTDNAELFPRGDAMLKAAVPNMLLFSIGLNQSVESPIVDSSGRILRDMSVNEMKLVASIAFGDDQNAIEKFMQALIDDIMEAAYVR